MTEDASSPSDQASNAKRIQGFFIWHQPEEYIQLFGLTEVPSGMLYRKAQREVGVTGLGLALPALELPASRRVSFMDSAAHHQET